MKISNASQPAKIFYGMHFEPGTAEYLSPDAAPYKILITEEVIRVMNPTYSGKPVYVDHVDSVDLKNVETEAAGWVVESFFNKYDGKTWAKFIIVSDKGFEAIRNGWKLSNSYIPRSMGPGGVWHGMDYEKEILAAEFEHLAIVQNPRYEESIILDPEQFRDYNIAKEAELLKIANSKTKKGEIQMGKFNFFKREKIENAIDLESYLVTLPKSKSDISVAEAVEIADKFMNMQGYASDEHMVKVNDSEEMSVKELRDCYGKMKSDMEDMKKANEAKDMAEKDEKKENKVVEEKEGDAEMKEQDVKNDDDEMMMDSKKNETHFKNIKNAHLKAVASEEQVIVLRSDRVAEGKRLFGSVK